MAGAAITRNHDPATIRALRERLERALDDAIALLDELDGDTDLEPSNGWASGEASFNQYAPGEDDSEEQCDDEGATCDDEMDHRSSPKELLDYPNGWRTEH